MSTIRTATDYDAAEALLDLCNFRQSENNNRNESVEPAKVFLNYIITSNEAEQPVSGFAANEVAQTVQTDNGSNVFVRKTFCDVGTQTKDPMIESMELTITRLREQMKSLEVEKSNFQSTQSIHDNDFDDDSSSSSDDDESFKPSSHEMTMDDSDETFMEPETPEQVKPKLKAGQYKGYNNTAKVLSNRNDIGNADDLEPIGEGNALIPSAILRHLNWNSYTSATRKLLTAVFTRRVLATHSLTGKPSPAFPNKPAKKKLDPVLIKDIVQTVVNRCHVPENLVRTSITTKCADESKMFRTREKNKKKRKQSVIKENIPPGSSIRRL